MDEPVQDGGGDRVVVEYLPPILEGPIGRQDHGALLIAVRDDLEEQVASVLIQGQETQFVDGKELWRGVVFYGARKGAVGLGGGQRVDDVGGGGPEGFDFLLAGRVGQGLGDMAFADAGGADEDEVFLLFDEIEAEGVQDKLLWDARGMRPVEGVHGFDHGELGLGQAQLHDSLMAEAGFLGEEVFQEGKMGEIFGGGVLGLVLKSLGRMMKTEKIEEILEVRLWAHGDRRRDRRRQPSPGPRLRAWSIAACA